MKKTIFLHIGTPKTGTTSIQQYLVANEFRLNKDGYLVPKASRKNYNHLLLANYALADDRDSKIRILCNTTTPKQISGFRTKFYRSLRKEISDYEGPYIVLSNEHCYRRLKSREELLRLKELFEGLCNELKIVVYIREQSDMLCSHYSTSLKNNNKNKIATREQFARLDYFDYNEQLKRWEEIFGIENIILRIFDKAKLYQRDVVCDFCKTLDMPDYGAQPPLLNVALNAKQCEFLRLVNINMPDLKSKNGIVIRKELNLMVSNTQIESPPVSVLIDQTYQEVYNESNRRLANRYYGNEEALFNKKPLEKHAQDQELLLTEADKLDLAEQIIDKNANRLPALSKCIAAIFRVQYKGKTLPIDYARNFKVARYDKQLLNRASYYWLMFFKTVKRRIRGKDN